MLEMTDEELIQRAASGDLESFNTLVLKYQKPIYNFCYKFLLKPEDAEEAVVDTFLKIHNNASSFNSSYKFSTWLFSIAKNCSLDIYRKQKKHWSNTLVEKDFTDNSQLPENLILKNDKENDLHEAFLQLDETKRIALILYIYHEHSYKDISEVIQTTESNVKNLIFRARQKLKEILGKKFYNE